MICEPPIVRGRRQGQPATGSMAGVRRHYRVGENLCEPCAQANRDGARRWERDNLEKRRQAAKKWARQWRRANPDLSAAASKRYRERHPARALERVKRWQRDNPESGRNASRRRRARLNSVVSIPFTNTELSQRLRMFSGCWLCGGPAGSVDHVIPLSEGGPHCLSNLRPACGSCNSSKGAKDWRKFV